MLKHILHMFVNDRKLGRWVTSQLLEMRTVITRVNAMRDDASTANVVLLPRKDICVGADKCLSTVALLIRQIRRKTTQQTVDVILRIPRMRSR